VVPRRREDILCTGGLYLIEFLPGMPEYRAPRRGDSPPGQCCPAISCHRQGETWRTNENLAKPNLPCEAPMQIGHIAPHNPRRTRRDAWRP